MQSWQQKLKDDPLPWLLAPENPSVRYWTLTELLEQPADSGEVQETKASIADQSLVKDLFALQRPEGYWGDETKPYTAQGTLTALTLLSMLGVSSDARTAAGCD
jgi:hypothetical protein